jgi:hypothetical protein
LRRIFASTQRKQVFSACSGARSASKCFSKERGIFMSVLAYHITWTTYGTWLPGDNRGWVKWGELGIKPPEPERERAARERMAESAVPLNDEQRALVEQTVRDHCRIRGWRLNAVHARTNHVHVVVTADRDADETMNQF